MNKPKILIIDDEKNIRESIKRTFRQDDYLFYEAENGQQGLDQVEKEKPHILILDLNMPIMDGRQFLKKLKPKVSDSFSILVLTGQGFEKEIKYCYEHGARFFLGKPVSKYEMRGLVKNMIALERFKEKSKSELSIVYDALASSPSGTVIIDLKGVVTYANSAFYAMFQFDEKENIKGKRLINVIQMAETDVLQSLINTENDGKRVAKEMQVKFKDRDSMFMEVTTSNVSDHEDNIIGRMISFEDITKRKQSEQKQKIYARDLAKSLKDLKISQQNLQKAYLDTIYRLSIVAEYHDKDTGRHIIRVSYYSEIIAKNMGLSNQVIWDIKHAAPMHDIGKIGIAPDILNKPSSLNKEEFDLVKKHPQIGKMILSNSESSIIRMAEDIAAYHHERWDGGGYPDGLSGEEIPLSARIVALVDVFDAITTERPYKKPFSIDVACEIIRNESGKHFDPQVVKIFFDSLDEFSKIMQDLENITPKKVATYFQ